MNELEQPISRTLASRIAGPNEPTVSFWRDVMVPKYLRFRRVLVGATAQHARRVLAIHGAPAGARVLDVGCGFGETTIEWARRVGEHGEAVGIDPCDAFLDVARADARAAGVTTASFRCGDAQIAPLSDFDRVFSAFGVMFFASPVAALRNLRRALVDGGRMQLLVWGTRAENPWLTLALEACARILPPAPQDGATCGPGPFSMSDPEALTTMLRRAGLDQIELRPLREDVWIGADVDEAIDFQLELGPAGERMRLAGAVGTDAERRIREELRRSFAACDRGAGVWLPSSVLYASGVV